MLIQRLTFLLEEGVLHTDTQTHTYKEPLVTVERERETAREHKGLPAKKLEERHGSDSPSEPPEQPT